MLWPQNELAARSARRIKALPKISKYYGVLLLIFPTWGYCERKTRKEAAGYDKEKIEW
jgi:hypothetical protein